LTNIRVAILNENYPEDKLSEEDQELILDRITGAFRTTPKGNLPQLRSYRLEGGALMYICAYQQSGQWLKNAMHGHKLRQGTTLRAKPVKMDLRTGDKQSKDTKELLQWIRDLNPGLSTEDWRVLDKQPEPKGHRLILLVDRDSAKAIKDAGHRVFTGLSEGVFKVLHDPEDITSRGRETSAGTSAPASGAEEGGTDTDTPSETLAVKGMMATTGSSKRKESEITDEGTPRDTSSVVKDIKDGEGMATDPP
jgi:hypothetical protein